MEELATMEIVLVNANLRWNTVRNALEEAGGALYMKGRAEVTDHLKILRTWASFAEDRDINFFTSKHFANMADWIDDAIVLLREQAEEIRQLKHALTEKEQR